MENVFELETYKLKDQVDSMMRFSKNKRESFDKYNEYNMMIDTLRLLINSALARLQDSRDAYSLQLEKNRDEINSLA